MTCAQSYTAADQIQVMKSDGDYDTYFLSNGHYGPGGRTFDANLTNKWANITTATVPATTTLPVGSTFWYVSRGAAAGNNHTITTAGGVDLAEKETYEINKAWTLIGCPFPAEVAINGGIEVTGETCAQSYTAADQIQVMKDDGDYATYFLSNGHYGPGGRTFDENLTNKWANITTATVPTTDKFPVGGGAWYLSRKCDGTLKFINPIK